MSEILLLVHIEGVSKPYSAKNIFSYYNIHFLLRYQFSEKHHYTNILFLSQVKLVSV